MYASTIYMTVMESTFNGFFATTSNDFQYYTKLKAGHHYQFGLELLQPKSIANTNYNLFYNYLLGLVGNIIRIF